MDAGRKDLVTWSLAGRKVLVVVSG
jgi:hypothetical protein